jgi:hypothetical protein
MNALSRFRYFQFSAAIFFALFIATSARAQTAGQIGPGTSGSIDSSQGVAAAKTGDTKRILANALTPQTRQTLKEAMESEPGTSSAPSSQVFLGPGEAAQIKDKTATKIDYASLPKPVKGALGGPVHQTLNSGSQH